MFHLTVLASGSSGNCSLLETPTTKVLVDAGLSTRKITQRLEALGVNPEALDAILLTHEHSDHAAAVGVWARCYKTPVYANRLTAEALKEDSVGVEWRLFSTGAEFQLGVLKVQSFAIPHDAAEPVGFVLKHEEHSVGFLTDLGVATKMVLERVRTVHTLLLEANHDEKLLQDDTRRPWAIKQRIFSRHGHLSNAAAAEVLAEIAGGNLRRVVLGHLSEDCNRPELALHTVRTRLESSAGASLEVLCAPSPETGVRLLVG